MSKTPGWVNRRRSILLLLSAVGIVAFVGVVLVPRWRSERPGDVPDGSTAATGSGAVTVCSRGPSVSFVATTTGHEQIYILDPTRSAGSERLTSLRGDVSDPAWSPDGRRIAFRWALPGRTPDVYIARADGSGMRLLVREGAMPDWSPSGRLIAFANLHAGDRGISTVNIRDALLGGKAIRIVTRTDDVIPEEQPAWSPDGQRIAFTSQRDGNSDIWIVNLDGTGLRNLTSEGLALDDSPSWSADGRSIAFGSTRASSSQFGGDIYVMGEDGSDVRRLTFEDSSYAPAWSPDDCGIAFNSLRSGSSAIYAMSVDGSNVILLTLPATEPGGEAASACCAAWRRSARCRPKSSWSPQCRNLLWLYPTMKASAGCSQS
jgi:TolB protein